MAIRSPVCIGTEKDWSNLNQWNRDGLKVLLRALAHAISDRKQDLTIIIAGSALKPLNPLLNLAEHSHHLDVPVELVRQVNILGTNLSQEQLTHLRDSVDAVTKLTNRCQPADRPRRARVVGWGAQNGWFDNKVGLYLDSLHPALHQKITDIALSQNKVVWRRKGLKLIRAPWTFSLCWGMDRATRKLDRYDSGELYDLAEREVSVEWLYRLRRTFKKPVSSNLLKEWTCWYGLEISDAEWRHLERRYGLLYGAEGICFDTPPAVVDDKAKQYCPSMFRKKQVMPAPPPPEHWHL